MTSDTTPTGDSDQDWRVLRNGCLWDMSAMAPWWLALPGFVVGGVVAAIRWARSKS